LSIKGLEEGVEEEDILLGLKDAGLKHFLFGGPVVDQIGVHLSKERNQLKCVTPNRTHSTKRERKHQPAREALLRSGPRSARGHQKLLLGWHVGGCGNLKYEGGTMELKKKLVGG